MAYWLTVSSSIVSLVLYLSATLTECQMTNPMSNQFIAVNSQDNVTYNCSVNSGRTVVWEVDRSQIRSSTQFMVFAEGGIIIDPPDTQGIMSTITITPDARMNDNEILVQCLASEGINSFEGELYRVITFDPPTAPGNLILEPALTLEWTRPTNIPGPENVDVNYTVIINSIDVNVPQMNYQNVTEMLSLSVFFLEEIISSQGSQCVEFEFIVTATNDAGTGPPIRLMDTVPISPDVTNVDNALRVVSVDLQTLSAEISFPPVQPCSATFPLTNYTLNINNVMFRELSPSDVMDGVPVTLSGLTRDNSFSLTICACNEVTCRTSLPRRINTTDVQFTEVVFFENRLFLRCSFAGNSQAHGCIVRLILSSTNETESFEVSRESGSMCTNANNQREAYSSVVVLDREGNGMEGNVSLNITRYVVNATSLEEYIELTGCRDVPDNTAAIVGGVLGSIAFLLLISVIVVVIVLFALGRLHVSTVRDAARGAPPMIINSMLRRKQQPDHAEERENLMTYECEVEAEEECAQSIKQHLLGAVADDGHGDYEQMGNQEERMAIQLQSLPSQELKDREAWIEGHDDVNSPLTINVRFKSLVQSLMVSKSLPLDKKPLLQEKDLKKVKVQIHI